MKKFSKKNFKRTRLNRNIHGTKKRFSKRFKNKTKKVKKINSNYRRTKRMDGNGKAGRSRDGGGGVSSLPTAAEARAAARAVVARVAARARAAVARGKEETYEEMVARIEAEEQARVVDQVTREAQEGNAVSMTVLSEWYRDGKMGLQKDPAQSVTWFEKAKKQHAVDEERAWAAAKAKAEAEAKAAAATQ